MNKRHLPYLASLALLCLLALGLISGSARAQDGDSGPVVIVGEAGSANFYASPETFPEPVVALIDAANAIKQEASFASDKTQILGTFDTAMFPLPAKYSINLPIKPAGTPIDLDNNGKTDTGVQVFSLDRRVELHRRLVLAATRTGRHGVVSDRYCDRRDHRRRVPGLRGRWQPGFPHRQRRGQEVVHRR